MLDGSYTIKSKRVWLLNLNNLAINWVNNSNKTMSKRSNQSDNPKQQFIDEFEDFGYDVKNVKRSSKKKVSKFKREVNEYDDTYWTGTLVIDFLSRSCIVYMFGIFSWWDYINCQTVSFLFTKDYVAMRQSNAWRITSVGYKNIERNWQWVHNSYSMTCLEVN